MGKHIFMSDKVSFKVPKRSESTQEWQLNLVHDQLKSEELNYLDICMYVRTYVNKQVSKQVCMYVCTYK